MGTGLGDTVSPSRVRAKSYTAQGSAAAWQARHRLGRPPVRNRSARGQARRERARAHQGGHRRERDAERAREAGLVRVPGSGAGRCGGVPLVQPELGLRRFRGVFDPAAPAGARIPHRDQRDARAVVRLVGQLPEGGAEARGRRDRAGDPRSAGIRARGADAGATRTQRLAVRPPDSTDSRQQGSVAGVQHRVGPRLRGGDAADRRDEDFGDSADGRRGRGRGTPAQALRILPGGDRKSALVRREHREGEAGKAAGAAVVAATCRGRCKARRSTSTPRAVPPSRRCPCCRRRRTT